jgi:hypothetical protein
LSFALPVGLVLLGGAALQTSSKVTNTSAASAPTRTTTSAAMLAVQLTPSPTSGRAAGATAATLPTPTAETPAAVKVANTNGAGVYLRRTAAMADRVKAYPDGTSLRIVGPDVDAGGTHWRHWALS